jgi:hypothetical protein
MRQTALHVKANDMPTVVPELPFTIRPKSEQRGILGCRSRGTWISLTSAQVAEFTCDQLHEYGPRFVIVSPQRARDFVLGVQDPCKDLSDPQYQLLELIGRSKRNGILQSTLAAYGLFHHIRVLEVSGLMYVVCVHASTQACAMQVVTLGSSRASCIKCSCTDR